MRTMKVVPSPTFVVKSMAPPCLTTTMARAMDSPWPVPFPRAFVLKKGS